VDRVSLPHVRRHVLRNLGLDRRDGHTEFSDQLTVIGWHRIVSRYEHKRGMPEVLDQPWEQLVVEHPPVEIELRKCDCITTPGS
jgi:hypothetical protein